MNWTNPQIEEVPAFTDTSNALLDKIVAEFSVEDAMRIKEIERTTNHDVKAVEYFLKEKVADNSELSAVNEFIHFACTSEDINNLSHGLMLREARETVILPYCDKLIEALVELAKRYQNVPMMARTHGQPASPTRLGKEFDVFLKRIEIQKEVLIGLPYGAKFSGATGNFNAHHIAYPEINWRAFGTNFVETQLGLNYSFPTTQIEHYDSLAGLCDAMKRINTIFIDLNRDIWQYIAMDYFKQKIKDKEVGSSAMPHKVNPIDFENSEGNLGLANAVLEFLSAKLPISRLQRDLTDSTVLRNVGVPFGHTLIGFLSTSKGLEKLVVNTTKIEDDLNANWAIIAEAIQTVLRKEGYPNPYEALKELTRTNTIINREAIQQFIDQLDVEERVKTQLKTITPFNYTGI